MDEAFYGMIAMFGFNYPPKNWAFCDGQLVAITQNTALFALLGTYYGGDGRSTFALPDLRGRVPVGIGDSGVLTPYSIGQTAGAENVVLIPQNLPSHTHTINATTDAGTTASPEGAYFANTGGMDKEYKIASSNRVAMNYGMVIPVGNNQPVSVLQPYLALNYCIALRGVFPTRK